MINSSGRVVVAVAIVVVVVVVKLIVVVVGAIVITVVVVWPCPLTPGFRSKYELLKNFTDTNAVL